MKKLALVVCLFLAAPVFADHHGGVADEVKGAVVAFNGAYESNDYETYFGFYTEDATLFFFGERQKVSDYYESWSASIKAGAGVDKYELSDVQIQVLPGGEAAVSSYFVVGTSHTADGVSSTVNAFESEVWQKIDGEWKIISLHYTEF